ncbi:glycosyltransferase family 2 protein [Nocardioides caldifontis]|uniref:glycosyltransferase family 2 protein n=1 Tax=Nocardioides caldifontis TaxID=2588938 RepID=UPI001EF1329C|nr:glycosyltransferase family 2 protein [Nocardioides caldifontis]
MVGLSVVVPCFNEEDVLEQLVTVLRAELGAITDEFEVLLVDDGSRDRTLELMRAAHEQDPRFRYLALSRNFGKEAAMLAGLTQARHEAVAILDADLQHPPELLAKMLPLLDQGYEQVVARRTRKGDAVARTLLSRAYYRMMNRLVDVELEDGVGDFRVLSRKAVRAVLALGEYNRFSKGLFAWIGFPTAVIDYENVARGSGATKWTMRALVDYGIDGVLSFNNRPLRLAIYLGALATSVAVGYALWVLVDAILFGNPAEGYVTIICAVVGLGGIQMMVLGVLGEYLGRIYAETKRRPHFLLRESSEGAATPVAVLLGPEHEQFAVADQIQLRSQQQAVREVLDEAGRQTGHEGRDG